MNLYCNKKYFDGTKCIITTADLNQSHATCVFMQTPVNLVIRNRIKSYYKNSYNFMYYLVKKYISMTNLLTKYITTNIYCCTLQKMKTICQADIHLLIVLDSYMLGLNVMEMYYICPRKRLN